MAQTADDILSLDAAAHQLGINRAAITDVGQVAALDERLAPLIESAIGFCEDYTGRAFLDTESERMADRPGDSDAPACLSGSYRIISIESAEYWSTSASLRDYADGTIQGSDLGRSETSGFNTYVFPPVGGWPEVLQGTRLVFTVKEGSEETPTAVRQACVVLVRDAFNGMPELRENSAAIALLRPYVWRGDPA